MELRQLIINLKKGKEEAFTELIHLYAKRLMTVAKVYTECVEDAEDVLQDTLIIIFRKISNFRGHEEKFFYPWMKKILINQALSRKRKKSYSMEQSLDRMETDFGFESNILASISEQEIMRIVFDLPTGYRQVFALFVIEGYSHKEIAEKLQIKTSTSRSQFIRAKRLLQEKINLLYKEEVS